MLSIALTCAMAPASGGQAPVRTDLYGDPLPGGARARLGTLRLRDGAEWIAFSPDGRTLAAASGGGLPRVRLWSVPDGALQETLQSGASVVEFSPDGRLLALGSWSGVVVWDIAGRRETARFERHASHGELAVAFSPDGRTLLVADDGSTGGSLAQGSAQRYLDVSTGRELRRQPLGALPLALAFANDEVRAGRAAHLSDPVLAFSGDLSSAVVWAYQRDGSIRLQDLDRQRERWRIPLTWNDFRYRARYGRSTDGFTAQPQAAFSPDGRTVAVSAYADVLLIDVTTGELRRRIEGSSGYITHVRYSGDGAILATAAVTGVIALWDGRTGERIQGRPTPTSGISALSFSPDGQTVVSAERDTVRLWDAQSGRVVREIDRIGHGLGAVGLSPQTRTIVTGGWNELHMFDLDGDAPRAAVASAHDGYVHGVRIFPDGRTAVTAGDYDPILRFWDVPSGRCVLQLEAARSRGGDVLLSRDGATLVSAFFGDVRIWRRVRAGSPPWRSRRLSSRGGLALSADGRVVATGGLEGRVQLWEAETGKKTMEIRPAGAVSLLTLSSDARLVAWAMTGVVEIYDVGRRQVVASLDSPDHEVVYRLAFSPDGATLAAGYGNGLIYLWDVVELPRAGKGQ
jgi:WD40 repeat protein